VACKILIRRGPLRLIAARVLDRAFQIIWNEQRGCPVHKFKCPDIRGDPVRQRLRPRRFRVGVLRGAHAGDKDLRGAYLAGGHVDDGGGVAAVVDEQLLAGTVHLAAERLRDKIARIVAGQFPCNAADLCFADGAIFPKGEPQRGLPFGRTAANAPHWAPALLPDGESPGLRETVFWTPEHMDAPDDGDRINTSAAYGFAFDICAVEIERATGRIRIDRYVTAHDAGTLLNPALADGQIRGAFAQGLGAALLEEFRYGEDGAFLSGTLADYLMPTVREIPPVDVIISEDAPSPLNPMGLKGAGEGGANAVGAAIAAAIDDALGKPNAVTELPITPQRLKRLMRTETGR